MLSFKASYKYFILESSDEHEYDEDKDPPYSISTLNVQGKIHHSMLVIFLKFRRILIFHLFIYLINNIYYFTGTPPSKNKCITIENDTNLTHSYPGTYKRKLEFGNKCKSVSPKLNSSTAVGMSFLLTNIYIV